MSAWRFSWRRRRRPSGRPLVLVKGFEGLGDRLITILVALLYVRLSGRVIAVDWRDGLLGEPGTNAFDALFRLENVDREPLPANDEPDVAPGLWRDRLDRAFDDLWREVMNGAWNRDEAIRRFSADLAQIEHPERVVVFWDFDQLHRLRERLEGELAELEDDAVYARLWRDHLRPSPAVDSAVSQWLGEGPTRRVGVHVRATREADWQQGPVALARILEEVDRRLGSGGDAEVVLATDNREIVDAFVGRFGERVRTRGKWFPEPWEPIHLAPELPDRARAAFDAAVELVALTRCDELVTRRDSSFSHVVRIATPLPAERVAALAPDADWGGWDGTTLGDGHADGPDRGA